MNGVYLPAPPKPKRIVRRRKYKSDIKKGRYIANPAWENSAECREEVERQCAGPFGAQDEFENYYPQDALKAIPEEGAWIVVQKPPSCEYTVPPFSIWYATNWQMDAGERSGVKLKRVKIITPKGDLGLFPCEYSVVDDIRTYVGRESDGILFHTMNGDAAFPTEQLFYLQSRGVRRPDACMMLLEQMHDPTFGWFEIAPPYGAHFGKEWPRPERCPFATPLKQWREEKAA